MLSCKNVWALGVIALFGCGQQSSEAPSTTGEENNAQPTAQALNEKVWRVRAVDVQITKSAPTLDVLGKVETYASSDIVSKVSADVLDVHVREGSVVQQGEVLVELDRTELVLAKKQAKARVSEAYTAIEREKLNHTMNQQLLETSQQQYDLTASQVTRIEALAANQTVSQRALDEAKQSLISQQQALETRKNAIASHQAVMNALYAQLRSAKVSLELAELNESYATVTAPFDGVVTSVNAATGSRAQPGQTLISGYANDSLEIRAALPQSALPTIRQSLANTEKVLARSQSGALELVRLSAQASSGGAGADAFFVPQEAKNGFVVGTSLSVQIVLPEIEGVIVLPTKAIHGANRVFRIEADEQGVSRLNSVAVQVIGSRSDETHGSVSLVQSADLRNGDAVLSSPLPSAISGLAVEVQ